MYDLRDPEYLALLHKRMVGPTATPKPTDVQIAQDTPAWANKNSQGKGERGPAEKYPWRTMPLNGTFRIKPGTDQPKYKSIYAQCSLKSKALGKKFRCHQYPDGTIEVWRQS